MALHQYGIDIPCYVEVQNVLMLRKIERAWPRAQHTLALALLFT